jgi:two-component system, NtrC family, nitrogen regulation sensor histidine kinase NtrY
LQNSPTYKRLLFKNSYLLIIAAWLITLSFIIDNYWSGNSSVSAVRNNIENYIQVQEKDFEILVQDKMLVGKINDNTFDEQLLQQLTEKPYFIYRYFVNDIGLHQLIFWNTQTVLPTEDVLSAPDSTGFINLDNGFYVWQKKTTATSITVALIPVKWDYFVTNTYLQNTFATGTEIERKYDISEEPTNAVVKSVTGKNLFYLTERSGNVVPKNNMVAVWFRIIAAIFILLFIHLLATNIAYKQSLTKALFFLIPLIFVLRLLSYYFPVPLNFRQFELFDPTIYGSNFVLRSLGDLLINAVLFMWVVLFIHHQLHEKKIKLAIHKPVVKWLLLAAVCILILAATFTSGLIIRSMVADSQISFDVINFFTLNIYSVTGFIVLCCIAIGYFLLSQVLLYLIQPLFPKNYFGFYLAIAIGGLIYLTFQLSITNAGFELFILAWLIIKQYQFIRIYFLAFLFLFNDYQHYCFGKQ